MHRRPQPWPSTTSAGGGRSHEEEKSHPQAGGHVQVHLQEDTSGADGGNRGIPGILHAHVLTVHAGRLQQTEHLAVGTRVGQLRQGAGIQVLRIVCLQFHRHGCPCCSGQDRGDRVRGVRIHPPPLQGEDSHPDGPDSDAVRTAGSNTVPELQDGGRHGTDQHVAGHNLNQPVLRGADAASDGVVPQSGQ